MISFERDRHPLSACILSQCQDREFRASARRRGLRISGGALLLLLTLPNFGCEHGPLREASAAEAKAVATEAKAAAIPVAAVPVTVQPSARTVNLVGTLFGDEQMTISSQVEGQIEA